MGVRRMGAGVDLTAVDRICEQDWLVIRKIQEFQAQGVEFYWRVVAPDSTAMQHRIGVVIVSTMGPGSRRTGPTQREIDAWRGRIEKHFRRLLDTAGLEPRPGPAYATPRVRTLEGNRGQSSALQPIPGLSAQRLNVIARHLGLNRKGPATYDILGRRYLGWACSGPIAGDDPSSLITLDIIGIDADQILSVSGQIHSSPFTIDFAGSCRRLIGYILAASDSSVAEPARGWLDHALSTQAVGEMGVDGVVFEFILHHDRALVFDIHVAGF